MQNAEHILMILMWTVSQHKSNLIKANAFHNTVIPSVNLTLHNPYGMQKCHFATKWALAHSIDASLMGSINKLGKSFMYHDEPEISNADLYILSFFANVISLYNSR